MSWQHPIEEARALIVKGDKDGALQRLMPFLNSDFFHPEALFMIGAVMLENGFTGMAAVLTSAAIDAKAIKGEPFPEGLMNLGGCYKAEHHNDIAYRVWSDALKCETEPRERAKIMTNMSGLFINEGCPEKAIPWCEKALAEDRLNYNARTNSGIAYLELKQWRQGWDGWAFTYNTGDRFRRRYTVGHDTRPIPEWKGNPNDKVIVFGDQGIGDEIYFANSLPDMIAACRGVILDCHPRLEELFRRSFPQVHVHGTRKNLSELDWTAGCGADSAIGLADLPGFFRNEESEWRGNPYLVARERREIFAGDRAHRAVPRNTEPSPLRIGLSWTGGVKKTRTELRSLPLTALEPILKARPDAHWFSLQYTPDAAREVCNLEEQTGIRISHFPGWVECFDYDRTASFVNSLDLIITVCTTVHHLGGAIGVPTWTLVPKRASWRYGITGQTLPWYDSVRLFRQEVDGDWSQPLKSIAGELADFRRIPGASERAA